MLLVGPLMLLVPKEPLMLMVLPVEEKASLKQGELVGGPMRPNGLVRPMRPIGLDIGWRRGAVN